MGYSKVVLLLYDTYLYLDTDDDSFEVGNFIEDLICDYPDVKFISYALSVSYMDFTSTEECMEYLLTECDEVWILDHFCSGDKHRDEIEYAEEHNIPVIKYTSLV